MNERLTLATACLIVIAVAPAAAQNGDRARGEQESPPPTPRFADGLVDFGGDGIWMQPWITDFGAQLVDRETIPFLPWTKAMYDYNKSNAVAYDPQGFCLPPGGPRSMGTPYPSEIIQDRDRGRIIIIFEGGAHVWREIHMDGRPLPDREGLNPTYFGYSVGRYEGDTLVVETTGFNEKTWLNFNGTMHTDELHTIERFSRPNRDTLALRGNDRRSRGLQ